MAKQYTLSSTASYLTKMYEFRQKLVEIEEEDLSNSLTEDLETAKEACNKRWYPGQLFFSIFKSKDDACSAKNLLTQKIDALKEIVKNNPITNYSFKRAWLKQIDIAIDAYIKVGAKMSQEFMNVNGHAYNELRLWISCYGSSFTDPTTLGSSTISNSCKLSNSIVEKLSFLNDISDKLGFNKILDYKNKIKALSSDLGLKIINLIDVASVQIILIKELTVSEASLNKQFSSDDSDKHLLPIYDIAQRVKAEMAVNDEGILNPQKYNVLYNAVTLTKLTLLSASQLNLLIKKAGVSNSNLFTKSKDAPFNLLFNSIKTIDGNHQWVHQAPAYPRDVGYLDTTKHFYGYAPSDTHGFKLFETGELRFKVFNKVFKGSLSLGLEDPKRINMEPILSDEYNGFISCEKNPFPYGEKDKLCQDKENNSTQTSILTDLWDDFNFDYLKELILSYFYEIIGEENINSIIQIGESIEINVTIPDSGITF